MYSELAIKGEIQLVLTLQSTDFVQTLLVLVNISSQVSFLE